MTDRQSYAVVFAGRRDSYQAAVAFHEVERLAALVTDVYCPDRIARLARRLPGALTAQMASRNSPHLRAARVVSIHRLPLYKKALAQTVGEYRALRITDVALGRAAAKHAASLGVPSLVYSYYWPGFVEQMGPSASESIVFQVHPLSTQVRAVLGADREMTGISSELDEEEVLDQRVVEAVEASLTTARAIIASSAFVGRGLVQLGVPTEKVAIVPYGCDCPAVPPRRARANGGPLRLLWVGQASYRKGAHHLLAALRSLPKGTAMLTMVCRGGDRNLFGELPAGVQMRSSVSHAELESLYGSHDLFVLPSLAEGFGLVYLEALAAGLPVIATPNTGIVDVVGQDGGVSVVPVGDVVALATCIENFAGDRAALRAGSQAAWESARSLSWPRFRLALREAVGSFSPGSPRSAHPAEKR
jgi:glycosyltransferase involved in cell wall biosynthesis